MRAITRSLALTCGVVAASASPALGATLPRAPADPATGGRTTIFEVRFTSFGSVLSELDSTDMVIRGPRGTKCSGELERAPVALEGGKTYLRFFAGSTEEVARRQKHSGKHTEWFRFFNRWCPGYYRGKIVEAIDDGEGEIPKAIRYFYFTVR